MARWFIALKAAGPDEQLGALCDKLQNKYDPDLCEPGEAEFENVAGDLEELVDEFKVKNEQEFPEVTVELQFVSNNGYGNFATPGFGVRPFIVEDLWDSSFECDTFDELLDWCKKNAAEDEDRGITVKDLEGVRNADELKALLADKYDDSYEFIAVKTIHLKNFQVPQEAANEKKEQEPEAATRGIWFYDMIFSADRKKLIRALWKEDGDFMVPEGVEVIASGAFDGKYIVDLVLPTTLKEIEKGGVANCEITDSIRPNPVTPPTLHEDIMDCINEDGMELENGSEIDEDDIDMSITAHNDSYKEVEFWRDMITDVETYEDFCAESGEDVDDPYSKEEWIRYTSSMKFDEDEVREVEYSIDENGILHWSFV